MQKWKKAESLISKTSWFYQTPLLITGACTYFSNSILKCYRCCHSTTNTKYFMTETVWGKMISFHLVTSTLTDCLLFLLST
ncbi:hypothetical protein OIU77_016654 [Salix suchowensis]|uniref:Uncharacterized protein n=1 Tax=Salix suchowensis TaxID=1278906 RepID=A0ABQ8ZLN1_9ROSI|nr:hypothetical protein OIU77_016654 [Salix suchowensis]